MIFQCLLKASCFRNVVSDSLRMRTYDRLIVDNILIIVGIWVESG